MRVLVVEDDEAISDAISLLLEDEGHQVTQAADGHTALEALREGERPALILLDVTMPVMTGLEFRAEQLRDEDLATIPVVLCTADARSEESARAMGVTEWLRKPLDPIRLLHLVSKYAALARPPVRA